MHFDSASFPVLSLTLVTCVAGLVAVLCTPAEKEDRIKKISAACSGLTLAFSLFVFATYDKAAGGVQFVERFEWVPNLGINYHNGVDGVGAPMMLLTGIVFFCGVLTMWDLKKRVKEFFALTILLVTGVFGMFMALDLFFLFVWYDVSLFPMYLLIAIWGSTRKEYAALKLTLYLLAGSALILPGIVYLSVQSGLNTFDLMDLVQLAKFTPGQQKFAFFLFYIGFGILAGVWPFHTWSPVGHVAAPTAVSMIHAGVLMKIGAFGVLRVGIMLCPEGWAYFAPLMAVLATIGIVYGAFAGLRQTDVKYVIGYSSVSHMGIVGLGLSTMTVEGMNGAIFQMFAHGVMTALFFSTVGYIYDRTHTKTISELGGISHAMPTAAGFFVFAALTGVGVPCLASFWAELTVFIAAFHVYPVLGILAVASLAVNALFILRVVQAVCFGPENPKFSGLDDMNVSRGVPRIILAATILVFGLMPFLMTDVAQTFSAPLLRFIAN